MLGAAGRAAGTACTQQLVSLLNHTNVLPPLGSGRRATRRLPRRACSAANAGLDPSCRPRRLSPLHTAQAATPDVQSRDALLEAFTAFAAFGKGASPAPSKVCAWRAGLEGAAGRGAGRAAGSPRSPPAPASLLHRHATGTRFCVRSTAQAGPEMDSKAFVKCMRDAGVIDRCAPCVCRRRRAVVDSPAAAGGFLAPLAGPSTRLPTAADLPHSKFTAAS